MRVSAEVMNAAYEHVRLTGEGIPHLFERALRTLLIAEHGPRPVPPGITVIRHEFIDHLRLEEPKES